MDALSEAMDVLFYLLNRSPVLDDSRLIQKPTLMAFE
jgi:hypothetical protein